MQSIKDISHPFFTFKLREFIGILGEATVQQEMKQDLEDMVEKLTNHCEDMKFQMQKQEKLNNDLVKERKLLMGKVEQLENDVSKSYEKIRDADGK